MTLKQTQELPKNCKEMCGTICGGVVEMAYNHYHHKTYLQSNTFMWWIYHNSRDDTNVRIHNPTTICRILRGQSMVEKVLNL